MRPSLLYLLSTQTDTHATADAGGGGRGGGGGGEEEGGAGAASFSSPSLGLSKEGLLATPYLLQPIFAHEDTSERVSDRARDSQPHKHTHTHTHTHSEAQKCKSKDPPLFSRLIALIARPRASIRHEIDRFHSKHFEGKTVIGIQLRRQNRARDKKGISFGCVSICTFVLVTQYSSAVKTDEFATKKAPPPHTHARTHTNAHTLRIRFRDKKGAGISSAVLVFVLLY